MAQKTLQGMLRYLVAAADMTIVDIAAEIGVSQPHVSRMLSGAAPTRQYEMGKRVERLYARAAARKKRSGRR